MNRRHFLTHMAGASALSGAAGMLTSSVRAAAQDMVRRQKAVILLWMGGGPATIDMWDMKPGAPTGGPFRPISTTGDVQICEHLPHVAQQMHHLSIVRSMSTREADHGRGRYYMHTGYVPNPSIEHPSYGAVVAKELLPSRQGALAIPPFVAVGGGSIGPGFLGLSYAPFVVNGAGRVDNLEMRVSEGRVGQRMAMLDLLEKRFLAQNRGRAAYGHGEVLRSTYDVMTSEQMAAFRVNQEPQAVRDAYGDSNIGRGCLLARRLVEVGVPFVEVDMGGWDTHSDNFTELRDEKLPRLDQAMAALVADLEQRGMLESTVVLWMGEFGRTPRINGNSGRDHWARSWSVVAGGGGLQGGQAIGATNDDGTRVETQPYSAEELMATILAAVDVPLSKTYTSLSGRPMKIAGGGSPIEALLG